MRAARCWGSFQPSLLPSALGKVWDAGYTTPQVPHCQGLVACCSKTLEVVGCKQDALAGRVEGISEELVGQAAKLEGLTITCNELAQVRFAWAALQIC